MPMVLLVPAVVNPQTSYADAWKRSTAEIKKMIADVDKDGSGVIDYNEFLTATMNREKILSKQNLEMAFKSFDRDGSGKISVDELAQIFNSSKNDVDKSVFETIVKDADQNNDGEISFEEFKSIMTKFFD